MHVYITMYCCILPTKTYPIIRNMRLKYINIPMDYNKKPKLLLLLSFYTCKQQFTITRYRCLLNCREYIFTYRTNSVLTNISVPNINESTAMLPGSTKLNESARTLLPLRKAYFVPFRPYNLVHLLPCKHYNLSPFAYIYLSPRSPANIKIVPFHL